MGRHTASRVSLTSVLTTAARHAAHGASRGISRQVPPARRSAFGVSAALATVALTATTTAAALADGTAPSGTGTALGSSTAGPSTTTPETTAALGTPTLKTAVVPADPATVEAASDALVRAEFLASEGAATLTPEQAAQLEQTRARLSEAVAAAGEPTGGALAGAATLAAGPADDDATSPEESATEPDGAGTLAADAAPLAERTADRASRSTARTPLAELTAPLPALTGADDARDALDTTGLPADEADEPIADGTATGATAATGDGAAAGTGDAGAAAAADASAGSAAGPAADPAAVATADEAAPAPAPTTEEITALTTELSTLIDAARTGVAVQVVPGPPSAEEVAAQLAQWAASTAGYGNGEIPASALCELSFAPGEQLRCDAAHQIEALNVKYREAFGVNLSVTDSYRSYSSQVAVKASRGYFAAPPGMSNHGWALALDLGGGIQGYGTAQYEWMRANAPAYGWDNPEWARAGGSKNEPWHWEYGDLS